MSIGPWHRAGSGWFLRSLLSTAMAGFSDVPGGGGVPLVLEEQLGSIGAPAVLSWRTVCK